MWDEQNLIAVTNRHLCEGDFLLRIQRICEERPKAILLREKDLSPEAYLHLAQKVLEVTRASGVPCILHSFPEAARALNVPYLHLPLWKLQELSGTSSYDKDSAGASGSPQSAHFLADLLVLGVSVHSREEAVLAQKLGATYLTAGHIFATKCKEGVPPRGLPFLKDLCEAVQIPVYAIGGITKDPARLFLLEEAGAAGACIMSGFMKDDS